ncbi:hypothetical protein HDU96_002442 [Phlyctochytrium bullatum]|nr:hypothetical protein HDU96_002442 [Phlyctochytrium bullatum]
MTDGDIDARVSAVLRAMGLTITWISFDSRDWAISMGENPTLLVSTAQDYINRVGNTGESALSLSHDAFMEVVPVGIEITRRAIESKKFKMVTIDQCLGTSGLGDGLRLPPSVKIPSGTC